MLLTVSGVEKHYADSVVLDGVSFRVDRREKVALVGRNGAGKTTLIKILVGDEEPDRGSVQLASGISIGYLRQHARIDENQTVLQAAEEARRHLVELERRLRLLESRLESGASEADLEEYSLLQEHFASEGGYAVERDLRAVLQRMGFDESEFDKPVGKLSGGEKTRLLIARLLLEEPDLLILDEPTNHLDLEATEWLEGWIRGYGGAVLLVSHDRTFLQNTAQRVLDMREGKVKSYPGPFEKFREVRDQEEAWLIEQARRRQQQIDKLDEFVRRFMNSQRTAQARGRLKQMEKLKADAIQVPKPERGMKAGFVSARRAGDVVFECKQLAMAFGARPLFSDLDWTVGWGERWGVIGGNGAGKSTLMKIILGRLSQTAGSARLGANVRVGYFAQDNADLDLSLTPIQLLNYSCGLQEPEARTLLGRFLISGDDAMRRIGTLSGGERNKLALAKITCEQPNLLILDEPTNHLDMDSREALAEVLSEYDGTLVLVSHDRWLLEHATDQTLDLRGDAHVQYPGDYAEYRAWRAKGTKPVAKPSAPAAAPKAEAPPEDPLAALTPRELSKEIARATKEVARLEDDVTALESELETHERRMASPAPSDDLVAMSHRYAELRAALDAAFSDWEKQAAYLERLKTAQGVGASS